MPRRMHVLLGNHQVDAGRDAGPEGEAGEEHDNQHPVPAVARPDRRQRRHLSEILGRESIA